MNLLVSVSFTDSLPRDEKEGFLGAIDDSVRNEFGFNLYDFPLVYNYFYADPDSEYGVFGQQGYYVLFNLVSTNPLDPTCPVSERNHVDYFLAKYGVDTCIVNDKPEATYGVYYSHFFDADEDPPYSDADPRPDTLYHMNSFSGNDGVTGKASADSLTWYFSGKHANLMFLHEFQHLCYHSRTSPESIHPEGGWPNEMYSTAAEYLVGPAPGAYSWSAPVNDVRCDQCIAYGQSYPLWRLFAAYIFHQFDLTDSTYRDDLMYQWRRGEVDEGIQNGLYQLALVLDDTTSAYSHMLSGADGAAKLASLFQDWAIAKALNDSTIYAPGDSIKLGFRKGLSPYYDIGLFRDLDRSCCAFNSQSLPHRHSVGPSSIYNFAWVTSYLDPDDIAQRDCPSCDGTPLTVAEKADPIGVPKWGSDYVLFWSDSLAADGPYDLKIKIRGERNPPPFNKPPTNTQIQVSVLTYSSPDSVFRTSDNLIEVRKIDISPDSAKANVTVCGFGDNVKAVLLIIGLAQKSLSGDMDECSYNTWDYKYGYTVEKHWKSGVLPNWNVAWFDSIHVNGDVVVYPGKTVTIEPGTIVEFFPGGYLSPGDRS